MNWMIKAGIQNAIALLPGALGYEIYYRMQRRFGGLREINPVSRLSDAIQACKYLNQLGWGIDGKVVMEIGTGRVPLAPLAFWLMGARRIITYDVNPYVRLELIKESLSYISSNAPEIEKLFDGDVIESRFATLLAFCKRTDISVESFLSEFDIKYIVPGDAAKTNLSDGSIDLLVSFDVLEHIPPNIIDKIFTESNRILRDDGLLVHKIDYSDHFSHSDTSISAINFLQYSDIRWALIAGNKYMYANRLRHDDIAKFFVDHNYHILLQNIIKDNSVIGLLKSSCLKLENRFCHKSEEVLSIKQAWIVSGKQNLSADSIATYCS